MIYVKNERFGKEVYDAELNLAIEYYLLNEMRVDEPILLFYINEKAIIVGKNQNTYEEINTEYVEEKGISVVRRFSGGGAVYHDTGVLNFCFITEDDGESFRDFEKFTAPIISVLQKMGAEGAMLKGRNDLVIGDRKFSGNAMYTKNGRMTAHGTLLFDGELDAVSGALKLKKHKLASKGIKSVRSRVTNIKPHLKDEYHTLTTEEFRGELLKGLASEYKEDVTEYVLTEQDWEKIEAFAKEYTSNWNWNYGKSPQFELERSERLSVGTVEVKMDVSQGEIQTIYVYGDFFGMGEIKEVEEHLTGVPYTKEAIAGALDTIDLTYYFGGPIKEELLTLLY